MAQQIGDRIAAWREERGWTQVELARAVKVRGETVSHWETGKSLPRGKTLTKLLDVVDAKSMAQFLGRQDVHDAKVLAALERIEALLAALVEQQSPPR